MLLTPSEDVDVASPVPGDLDRHMGGSAESVQPQLLFWFNAALLQSPVADDASTEERGGLLCREVFGNPVDELLRNNRVLGIASINMESRETGFIAQILAARLTVITYSTSGTHPRNTDRISHGESRNVGTDSLDGTYDLMAGNEG